MSLVGATQLSIQYSSRDKHFFELVKRALHIILLLLSPLCGFAITFDEMLSTMNELSLPLVNIEVNIDTVSYFHFVPGTFTLTEFNDSVTTHTYNCLVRHRGKTAIFLPKKSFAIKLVDDEGEKLDANLLGLRTDNSWILNAMGIDKLRMRDRVCFDIWNEFSHTMWDTKFNNRNGTVGSMVEVFINGEYNGIYCLTDKINRQLLNLRKAKVEEDSSVTVKGLLYKGKDSGLSDFLLDYQEDRTDTLMWNTFELQYPDDYPSPQAWQPLMDLIDFNGKSGDEYFKAHYNEWYYDDNLVDFWILIMALGQEDMPYRNTFISTPDINFEHRYMLTPWDLDACLGRNYMGNESHFLPSLFRLNCYGPFNRLVPYNINGFKNKLARRWFELIDNELSPENLENHLRAIAQRYVESGAWEREYTLWKHTSIAIGRNIENELQYVMTWYTNNISILSTQINRWKDDYNEDDILSSNTITKIYNYLLNIDPAYDEKLDVNNDGCINSNDVTRVYNFILGIDN